MDDSGRQFSLGDHIRPFERLAATVVSRWSGTVVGRLRDAIELHIPATDENGSIVVILTPDAAEVRLPTTDWTGGAYGPVPSSRRWKRLKLHGPGTEVDIVAIVEDAQAAHRRRLQVCQYCGARLPPEHMTGRACHACATRELGVVY